MISTGARLLALGAGLLAAGAGCRGCGAGGDGEGTGASAGGEAEAQPDLGHLVLLSTEAQSNRPGLHEGSGRVRLARVDRGTAQISGRLTMGQIDRTVVRHGRGLRYCYERELHRVPDIEGIVVINWIIGSDGTVGARYVDDNTMRNRNVETCVLREVGRMHFPPPEGGGQVTVTYPFVFAPEDDLSEGSE